MALISRSFSGCGALLLLFYLEIMFFMSSVCSELSDDSHMKPPLLTTQGVKGYRRLLPSKQSSKEKDIGLVFTYTDADGNVRLHKIKSSDLSSSWVWDSSGLESNKSPKVGQEREASFKQIEGGLQDGDQLSDNGNKSVSIPSPVKLKRQKLRRKRKQIRVEELIQTSKENELWMEKEAIERSRKFNNKVRSQYSIWRREFQSPKSDSTLKLMRDQIIMAKVYACIARSKEKHDLYDSLMKHIKESHRIIREANSDAELHPSAIEQAKAMGHVLSLVKDFLYDCDDVARKLRVMVQSTDESIYALKKQSMFLIQHAAKTVPKPLHCLPLHLTTDYFVQKLSREEVTAKVKLVDNSLYHYAIFSDNVLATSVAVNSTVVHAMEPAKHVFHIVTDKLNFAAMKMWFILHSPFPATVHVQNIDEFKWLNSSYCSVLRQLESARLKEYYFKTNHPSSVSVGDENLKYRNPKYLSMLNHLRFYMPEVYPKLDKILFLDDDIVVQKDLTPLWSIDMKGMVNAAVETCKESFHRFDTYLNFSNPKIAKNFDPQACGWAFGMNLFDLKEWKKQNITGVYHYWQDLNEDRQLWKLGSLPPGLITFYGLTYVLDRSWHVLGLGYDASINPSDIEKAAVIHYNGNYKPWLDLAITKFQPYWSKYVKTDSPYIQRCYLDHAF